LTKKRAGRSQRVFKTKAFLFLTFGDGREVQSRRKLRREQCSVPARYWERVGRSKKLHRQRCKHPVWTRLQGGVTARNLLLAESPWRTGLGGIHGGKGGGV